MSNWKPIGQAKPGIGPVLLRVGADSLDPVFVGSQRDDGSWVDNSNREVRPLYFAQIPLFDADGDEAAA